LYIFVVVVYIDNLIYSHIQREWSERPYGPAPVSRVFMLSLELAPYARATLLHLLHYHIYLYHDHNLQESTDCV